MTSYEVPNREWWVLRWLDLLDKYRFKKRLERGRRYATEGNILSIAFQGAEIVATVQGTENEPYELSIYLDIFSNEDWDYVIETMSQKAIFSAQLLTGEMPPNIEEVFTANGLSLFPFSLSEVHSRCSCPDPKNPCKHIAAVYYQLGDRFSEDPFVLFQLRGRTREQILDRLRQIRSGEAEEQRSGGAEVQRRISQSSTQDSQTPLNIEKFWQYDEPLDSSLVVIAPPPESKTVLDILGTVPLASSDAQAVRQYLEQVYATASQRAMMSALNREEE
ncbi:MAG: hypothetical protein BRC38_07470 [Cyanobacteria bacterium QH_6_48_35]|jgi:uncharacterized Zn finger protein|nr:MAG: hypothetical protein BRC34_07940 [Cyanobacteria bacterium QH_1_48_107]PSO55739.1 MAG: hypothetical protein BRC35_11135 [Cyanobacteria bacterium QH_10_48_56]PSO63568.1 MAG: hypothetical protein BRC39_04235 [Cyanobacteria bacterium QH_7_48_89]PSO65869.1 MAG: hypothetical protein BRC38_07470 [Cyanobacteria bacterium QH_6_48_35]PSO73513.1 MAG: hypothetical protein BRC37_09390 [Cyanobacteria bacterium QH_3_48_40]PSO82082.1 MAG: hypothetical protein BRC45_10385 [Cyanobacteria bacterium QS_5_